MIKAEKRPVFAHWNPWINESTANFCLFAQGAWSLHTSN
jgi:hypothetical protein